MMLLGLSASLAPCQQEQLSVHTQRVPRLTCPSESQCISRAMHVRHAEIYDAGEESEARKHASTSCLVVHELEVSFLTYIQLRLATFCALLSQ
ncbi:hypothetical protein K466DRAFT_584031 [Polyporus arcularius HHB13444]|uniref:Uncharacterized protein n=1 Tax=Polyporus arcularius HHB13444 TaxID=1314778 RepID=A0A5C3PPB1_9APHY|nr:hypothetical protein K466DRAFT_584031 [Polyporus arcularius HHB13444]